ncbi:MAG: hypothetical protein ABIJ56_19865 [Pseudomonadota bacterium]
MQAAEAKKQLRKKLKISSRHVKEINDYFLDPNSKVMNDMLDVVLKYGTPREINRKATKAKKLSTQMKMLKDAGSPFLSDLRWLIRMKAKNAFITMDQYRKNVLGSRAASVKFNESDAVTLEVSAMQYVEWLRVEAQQAIDKKELMPGRFIRVRSMKDQLEGLEPVAMGAAMNIMGASFVETLDTKGTDGSNVHLGGPETITGYFGGVGQPNEHALQWLDEYLKYYTEFGITQVLNINAGTILLAYFISKLGIDNEFKISVFMGNDNAYAVLWTLLGAKLLCRTGGRTPLIGFNYSNSVNNDTIELSAEPRKALGFEQQVRFEHHIIETAKSIVVQPYDRRQELLEVAPKVRNISAKHEGGDVEVEKTRGHPSDILDYFVPKKDVLANDLWDDFLRNYLDKHDAVNHTARALTEKGIAVIAAKNLH